MGKKKGGKGKKEKSEDGLPPPPDLDSQKEGAREALLTFRQVISSRVGLLQTASCARTIHLCFYCIGFRARRTQY